MPAPLPENRLLLALPPADRARLTARMKDVTFGHMHSVYRAEGPIEYVYFPRSGVLSAVVAMVDGETAEAAVIGFEGMIGATAALGAKRSTEEVYCQVPPAQCRRLPASAFLAEVRTGGHLQAIVYRY